MCFLRLFLSTGQLHRSVKEECLCKVVLFGERSLRRALSEYVEHFHTERNHQGKGNVLLFPGDTDIRRAGPVQCRERLGGLLRYYHQEARRCVNQFIQGHGLDM